MSYAKQKGTSYETAIVKYLIEHGFVSARRIALAGANDKGDIHIGTPNKPDFVIECKNYAKELTYTQIENFYEEAFTEYKNATDNQEIKHTYYALLFVKRINLGISDSWVCWKNEYGITIRCRLGDLIDDDFNAGLSEITLFNILENRIKGIKQ